MPKKKKLSVSDILKWLLRCQKHDVNGKFVQVTLGVDVFCHTVGDFSFLGVTSLPWHLFRVWLEKKFPASLSELQHHKEPETTWKARDHNHTFSRPKPRDPEPSLALFFCLFVFSSRVGTLMVQELLSGAHKSKRLWLVRRKPKKLQKL